MQVNQINTPLHTPLVTLLMHRLCDCWCKNVAVLEGEGVALPLPVVRTYYAALPGLKASHTVGCHETARLRVGLSNTGDMPCAVRLRCLAAA
jgi:hypothetical protein